MKRTFRTSLATFAAAALVLTAGQAFAAGTDADSDVTNTANVSFTIGGIPSGPVPSNTVTFKVDHKIRVVVAGAPNVNVIAGATDYALPFTVTNESNTGATGTSPTWFKLTAVDHGGDDFDMTGVEIWQDTDADGTPDVNLTAAIGAGQTAVYIALNVDELKNIIIVADTPNNATTRAAGNTAEYNLVAQAWNGDLDADLAFAQDTPNTTGLENVWADDQGTAAVEAATPDGIHSALGIYTTTTPIAVVKGASNGTSGYHIPGDFVTYTVTVTNSAATDATAVAIYDAIPVNTQYNAITPLVCTASGAGVGGTPQWSTDGGTNYVAVEPAPASITHVRCDNGTAEATGGTVTMTFSVEIQ